MVTEIRGPLQGGLSNLIQKQTSAPGALSKASPSSNGIEQITEEAKNQLAVQSQKIPPPNQQPEGIGIKLDIIGSYILPVIYLAGNYFNSSSL